MAVDSRSIAGLLRPGLNRIAVQVHSPGHSHFSYVHRGACGLICWLDSPDRTLLRSDILWRSRRNPSWAAPIARVSIYGTGVEERDMAQDDAWQDSDVDWPAARIVATILSALATIGRAARMNCAPASVMLTPPCERLKIRPPITRSSLRMARLNVDCSTSSARAAR